MTKEAIPAARGSHHLLLSVFPAPPLQPAPGCLVLRGLWRDLWVTVSWLPCRASRSASLIHGLSFWLSGDSLYSSQRLSYNPPCTWGHPALL